MHLISAVLPQNGTDEPYSGGRIKYALQYDFSKRTNFHWKNAEQAKKKKTTTDNQ